jgi:hypothetical protein
MALEIQILAWGGHKNVVMLNRLMGSQPMITRALEISIIHDDCQQQ